MKTLDSCMDEVHRQDKEIVEAIAGCRERDYTIAQQRADIEALVNLIVAQYGWQCHPTKEATTSAMEVMKFYDIARPIIERYRAEGE
jgi:hypothetical protein